MASPFEAKPITVLVVEAPGKKGLPAIMHILEQMEVGQVETTHAASLSQALEHLNIETFQVILLDLDLPDSQGLATLSQILARAPEVAVVVLSPNDDRQLSLHSLREGAQDFLIKGEVNASHLRRAMLFAIERQRTRVMLQQMSFNDDLTGLLNRRGFLSLAQQQLKIAKRENWELVLLFADLDGLKNINDTFGHPEGDRALRAAGAILQDTFRTSDLVARLGGDEFVVLAINAPAAGVKAITSRLQKKIDFQNAQNRYYQLSLSFGIAQFDPRQETSLEEIILKADKALYENKRRKFEVGKDEVS
ncbi:MAG TPA: GGDEF domain-containing response regulator [Anaerolineales bacterium]|nr:GGDEF domain-containing response regulator [Anaerolineales bacterium]